MAKVVRVPIHRTSPTQTVQVEAGATVGATFGVNLRWPDGRMVSADDFTVPAAGDSSITTTDDIEEGQWNLWFTPRRAQDAVGAILADTDTIDLAYVAGTSITATLKDLADSGAGSALVKITRDSKGRISGTEAATTTDLPEGANLYFTDARAQAAVVVSSITDGDTDHSPSGDAVFDALAGKEPAITAGTAAQFRRGDKTWGNALIGGGMGTFPGNNTAGTTAVCYEVGTDVVGRGASIKSVRGASSFYTGMVLSAHNSTGDLDLVSINDDSTVNFGTTLYIDEVNSRVGVGAAPTTYSFEVNSSLGGIFLNRQSTVLEPFILMRSNGDAATGGQIRSSATGYGIRLTTPAAGQPTMLGVSPTQVAPGFDNAASSATASLRWSVVYAATGTINTSDAREKTDVVPLTAAELAAASDLARAPGTYQWLASVAEKGADKARHHAGLTVQRAIEIMQSHGLDPMRYGFICYDQWDETPEVMDPETGEVTQAYRPAGDRYSFRTDELLLFMARGFAARLDALEAKA